MRIRFKDSFDPYFVHSLFQTNKIQHELEIRKAGTTNVFAIYYKNLQTVPIIKPPAELQKKFGQIIKKIRMQKLTFETNLVKIENLFQSLQRRAFKGELFNNEFPPVEPQEENVWQQTSLF
jgi:type I restriction enzyme S subunit